MFMDTVRLNITLPVDVADSIKHVKNKSAFITEALKEYVHNKKFEALQTELKEGYMTTKDEDIEISTDWDFTIRDGLID